MCDTTTVALHRSDPHAILGRPQVELRTANVWLPHNVEPRSSTKSAEHEIQMMIGTFLGCLQLIRCEVETLAQISRGGRLDFDLAKNAVVVERKNIIPSAIVSL